MSSSLVFATLVLSDLTALANCCVWLRGSLLSSASVSSASAPLLLNLSVTISEALLATDFKGLNMRLTQVMVCLLINVSKAIAEKNSTAVSPGGPITFSMYSTPMAPWLPPGLNTHSVMKGDKTLDRNNDSHIMLIAIPKNHFHRLTVNICIIFTPTNIRKAGMRKAEKPKFSVINK